MYWSGRRSANQLTSARGARPARWQRPVSPAGLAGRTSARRRRPTPRLGSSDASEASGGAPGTTPPLPPPSPEAERDWMLGCVVAGFCDAEVQKQAIVAVADRFTQLGKLSLAVPLLFLIGLGAEACTRLQAAGRWEYAATLAKASLPPSERSAVLGKWAEHLMHRGEQHRAIEVLLSLGKVQEAAERLIETSAFDKAALLLCALREAHEARRGALSGFAFRGAARVLLEYAAFLTRLGLHALAVRYTALASETAEQPSVAGGQGKDEPLTELEAAQLVVQLAKLQERNELVEPL